MERLPLTNMAVLQLACQPRLNDRLTVDNLLSIYSNQQFLCPTQIFAIDQVIFFELLLWNHQINNSILPMLRMTQIALHVFCPWKQCFETFTDLRKTNWFIWIYIRLQLTFACMKYYTCYISVVLTRQSI